MNAGGVLNTCRSNEKVPACRDEYSGARVSNTWIIYLRIGNNCSKGQLIPDKVYFSSEEWMKGSLCFKLPFEDESAHH